MLWHYKFKKHVAFTSDLETSTSQPEKYDEALVAYSYCMLEKDPSHRLK